VQRKIHAQQGAGSKEQKEVRGREEKGKRPRRERRKREPPFECLRVFDRAMADWPARQETALRAGAATTEYSIESADYSD